MIKLKDILNESNYKPNEPIGKVMTDKDHPPFMTEDQWMEKWTENDSYQLTESDRIIIQEGNLTNKVTGELQRMVVAMLTSVTKKYIPISFNSWPLKAKKQHLAKVQAQLPLYDILQKYINTGRVMPNDMKTLGAGLKKYAGRHAFQKGGIIGFTIGLIFSTAAATAFAATAGGLILGTMATVIWRIAGVDWFMAGVKRDSERKQIASKVKRAASKNLSNSKVSLPKKVGNINLQSYESGKKSIDPKDFQPFGFRTRL